VTTIDQQRVLITGASGFAGRHLATYAAQQGALVYALSRRELNVPTGIAIQVDLAQAESVAQAVQLCQPDYVFQLAAQTPANALIKDDRDWLMTNPLITLNVLEAVRLHRPQARILVVSSSSIYGHVAEHALPIHEDAPLHPTTMYGVSKASQELVAIRYVEEYGLDIMRARPFNQLGPGEPRAMLTSTLAAQVADIAAGRALPTVRMRHRATRRDFTDIRDAVRAYWQIAERGLRGDVYNICSGVATPIGEIAAQLIDIAGVSADIEETESVRGVNDILVQAGSHAKLTQAVGWKPQYDLRTSLADLLGSFLA
jgi:GDP-4-dehydro-6-deoxy-D-mannose reductase